MFTIKSDLDKLLKQMDRQRDLVNSITPSVSVGWQQGRNADIARWLHNGVKTKSGTGWRIVPRPFFDVLLSSLEFEKASKKWNKEIFKALNSDTPKPSLHKVLNNISVELKAMLEEILAEYPFTPNQPSTIKQKQNDTLFIDTGEWIKALQSQVGIIE
ncbi:hypothetical protein P0J00_003440 [Vibrio vulnificus]|nr:hypothetical protein [Vibrio vulnificus]EKO5193475.1 hypothetical protein [Vibrio vulnificus]